MSCAKSDNSRLPGCGKSTLCHPLTEQINAQFRGGHIARCVSLDGWHLPRSELDKFPNAAEAHYRRVCLHQSISMLHTLTRQIQGAPFTFDVKGYTRFLHLLRNDFSSPIDFPVFEHSVKDPAPSGKPILPCERIVIIEGLYTLLSDGEWRPLSESLDYSIYMDIDRNIARERCIERNFKAGLTETIEKTTERGELQVFSQGCFADSAQWINQTWSMETLLQLNPLPLHALCDACKSVS